MKPDHNVILTGLPRSGTTLSCYLLNKCDNVVALHEPIDFGEFKEGISSRQARKKTEDFFRNTRRSLLRNKTAVVKHSGGNMIDNPFRIARGESGLRRSIAERGEVTIEKHLTKDFTLVIKHPSAFSALLPELLHRFPCFAIIRNPLSTLASWNSVNVPVQQGHLAVGERFDSTLRVALARLDDRIDRQFFILDWFFERFAKYLPRAHVLRYEDIVDSGGKVLNIIISEMALLNHPLENKNLNTLYDREMMHALGKRLLDTGGTYWQFYSKEEVEALLDEIERNGQ